MTVSKPITLANSANNLHCAGYDKLSALLCVSFLPAPVRMCLRRHLVKKRASRLHCAMGNPGSVRSGVPVEDSYPVQYLPAISIVKAPVCVSILFSRKKEYTVQPRRKGWIFTHTDTLPQHLSAQHSGHDNAAIADQSFMAVKHSPKITRFNDFAGRLFGGQKMIIRHRSVPHSPGTLA